MVVTAGFLFSACNNKTEEVKESTFGNLTESVSSPEFTEIKKEVFPLVSTHFDEINLNEKLFARIKTIYDKREELGLTTEQNSFLELTYKNFVRGGANLNAEDKEKVKEINGKLSLLGIQFGENLLAETNSFTLVIDKEEDLAGLPQSVIAASAEAAKEAGQEGKWLFTLQKPSLIPFLQYSEKRELREKLFKGYINRGDNNNDNDNKSIISQIIPLRIEKANLLGFNSYAEYVLEQNMAKKPENVYKLLNKIMDAALPIAKKEAEELQKLIKKEGHDFELEAWDWWYYAEKLKKEKYDINDEELRPYFKLANVRQGTFDIATKLFGITFEERKDIPVYHEDATAYEVKEADGSHIGILYMDWHPRESKRAGAWMTSFRKQSRRNGKDITPVISVVCNFSKPTGDTPALLSFGEVTTLLHEFGHALHGLLSDCTYNTTSGTSVARDFVELPSQIMENWAGEPEALEMYARHYETGEVIPVELVEKLKNSGHFNQGFVTVEYVSAALLDMKWHTMTEVKEFDVNEFEKQSLTDMGLIPEIVVRYRSTYFSHIFDGGYSAGYYGYIWAAILDADAFEAFKETGIFNKETAKLFRENILERGGTDDPMILYKKFRGAEPSEEPLLKRRGLL
jgi:peptidyl-dipeptidase Dcp